MSQLWMRTDEKEQTHPFFVLFIAGNVIFLALFTLMWPGQKGENGTKQMTFLCGHYKVKSVGLKSASPTQRDVAQEVAEPSS